MAKLNYDKMIKNRSRMFKSLGVSNTFEPFIGYTYMCEGQKRVLFVAYDEWSFVQAADAEGRINKFKPLNEKQFSKSDINIQRLFRMSPYYDHIDEVMKSITYDIAGYTTELFSAEDVAFHNFIVRPIDWKFQGKLHEYDGASYIPKSVETFKAVIDFCNPDMVVFCTKRDKEEINKAFKNTLADFLMKKGIEWLETGNLNFDMHSNDYIEQKDGAISRSVSPLRVRELASYVVSKFHGDDPDDNDDCRYDNIHIDVQRMFSPCENIKGVRAELQHLAQFIQCEFNATGSFMRQCIYSTLKKIERQMQNDFFELMDEYIEYHVDEDDYGRDPLCTFARPTMYHSLHMVKALTKLYQTSLILPVAPKRKFCCSFASEKKQNEIQKNTFELRAQNKINIIKSLRKQEPALNQDDRTITTKRWNVFRNSFQKKHNEYLKQREYEEELENRVKDLFDNATIGEELSQSELDVLDEYEKRNTISPSLLNMQISIAQKAYANVLQKIIENACTPLEELASIAHTDEHYLRILLEADDISWNASKKTWIFDSKKIKSYLDSKHLPPVNAYYAC